MVKVRADVKGGEGNGLEETFGKLRIVSYELSPLVLSIGGTFTPLDSSILVSQQTSRIPLETLYQSLEFREIVVGCLEFAGRVWV